MNNVNFNIKCKCGNDLSRDDVIEIIDTYPAIYCYKCSKCDEVLEFYETDLKNVHIVFSESKELIDNGIVEYKLTMKPFDEWENQ